MRSLAVLVVAGIFGIAATPSSALALPPAFFHPAPPWVVGLSTKVLVRAFEFVDWALEDLRAQVDRRNRWDPPPPVVAPGLESVASGGSTTAPPEDPAPRRSRTGMIP